MKQAAKGLVHSRPARFATIGLFNTGFDFLVLNLLLFGSGQADSKTAVIVFNTISASLAALVSFFLNRNYVFRSHNTPHHYVLYFVVVTLSGLYVIQNLIIWGLLHWLGGTANSLHSHLQSAGVNFVSTQFLLVNGSKAVGTIGSLIWNYNLYKRYIFNRHD